MDKETTQDAHIYFPKDIYADLKAMAKRNRRTMNGEVILAVEAALAKDQYGEEHADETFPGDYR